MLDHPDIAKKIALRDPDAFEALYRECAPRLLTYLRQLLGHRQAAQDVMQNTFTELWKRPGSFDPQRGTLRAWLFGAARRQAAEWWRHHHASDPLDFEAAGANRTEASSIMADALQRLPEEQRTLLWLREVEGHSYAELAAVLNVPIGTVRSRLFTAREALRGIWSQPARLKGDRA